MDNLRCWDYKTVKRILTHKSVFSTSKDDGEYAITPVIMDSGIWLKPYKNTLVLYKPVNLITYECHMAIIAGEARNYSQRSAIKSANWLFTHTRAEKIMGFIPELYRPMVMMMRICGGEEEGRLKESWLADGKKHDLILIGITKHKFYEVNSCHQ